MAALPNLLSAVGFSSGIAASSPVANMMSATAKLKGVGVVVGSLAGVEDIPAPPPNHPKNVTGVEDIPSPPPNHSNNVAGKVAMAVVGGVGAVAAAPLVLGAMGFTSSGIVASSLAAKMMSMAAIANGGGVAAGGLVATLQSAGAAGLSVSSNIILGSVGSALGWFCGSKRQNSKKKKGKKADPASRDEEEEEEESTKPKP